MVSKASPPSERIKVKSNFFELKIGQVINRYKIDILQDDKAVDPVENWELFIKVASIRRKILGALYGSSHYRVNNIIYSTRITDEQTFEDEVEGAKLKTTIRHIGVLEVGESSEVSNFLGRIFKSMQAKLKLKMVARKYFDDKAPVRFSNWKLELWPGYMTSLAVYGKTPLINIDVCFKTIREKTVAELIRENKSKWMEGNGKLKEMLVGTTVMTMHNRILFRIEDVDMGKRPIDTFTKSDGTTISYLQYFKDKYNKDLKEKDMPMMVQKKKKNGKEETHYFPPELCLLTGLSNEMKENRNLMKDLAQTTKPNPSARLQKCADLCKLMERNEGVNAILKDWDLMVSTEPATLEAKKFDAGKMVLGSTQLNLENNPQLDRDSQTKMVEQPKLESWVIFYPKRDDRILDKFMDTIKQSIDTYGYEAERPKTVGVGSREADAWIEEIERNTDQRTRMAVFLLEGKKKAAPLYDDIKRYLITKRPIPSQVVLTSTANSDKGLRSICNKILVQICAKVGGVPWNVNNLPLSEVPTMIVGIDVFHKMSTHKKSLLAFTATMNREFSKYWSTVRQQEEGQEIGIYLESAFIESVKEFRSIHKFELARVIVYRDGVSDSQRQAIQAMEVSSFVRGVNTLVNEGALTKRPELIFICSNKRVTAKFFNGDQNSNPKIPMKNPLPGTTIDSTVTHGTDFYLTSQTVREGSVTPTHYFVLGYYQDVDGEYRHRDEAAKARLSEIQLLTYKLCYLYYNWTGAVKVPAPIHYADRLASLIGDRWQNGAPMIPHSRFGKAKSLYFI